MSANAERPGAALFPVGGDSAEAAGEPGRSRAERGRQYGHFGWISSLFLLGLGMKLLIILRADSPLPYNDQWEGEAADTYVPWFEHVLSPTDLFRAHNEHRIFFTRTYDLSLLLLNQQWDSQLQMLLNAILHCGTLAGFGFLMARLMGSRFWPAIWLPLALVLVLPVGWENTVWAFQSSFYFLLASSLLTIWLLGLSQPFSRCWRWGVLVGGSALFTAATGFVAAVAAAALALVDVLKGRRSLRSQLPTLTVCAVITVAGLLLKADVPRHHSLTAHSPGEFLGALGLNLAWPLQYGPWFGVLNLLPLLLLGWIYFRSDEMSLAAERMVLGIGFWAILQSAAIAYSRGGQDREPAARYADLCCFLMVANCLSVTLLLTRHRQRLRFARCWQAGFAVWSLGCLAGLGFLTSEAWTHALPIWKEIQAIRLANARAFLATDNEQVLLREPAIRNPLPYAPELVFLLRYPPLRRVLPACLREPLRVLPGPASDGAFVTNGCALANPEPPTEPCWGSWTQLGPRARGTFESLPIRRSTLPYLEIPVAGHLGGLGLSLELVELATGKATAVSPPQTPRVHWRSTYVKAPAGEFKLVARDESSIAWFAFKEPREVGHLSYWTLRTLAAWKWFLAGGLGCLLWSLAACVRRQPSIC